MKKATIKCETRLNAKRYTIVDENGNFLKEFGCWKNQKALVKNFNEKNNGAYTLA